jgi:hypothetical protein
MLRNFNSIIVPSAFQRVDDRSESGSTGKNSLIDAPRGLFKNSPGHYKVPSDRAQFWPISLCFCFCGDGV